MFTTLAAGGFAVLSLAALAWLAVRVARSLGKAETRAASTADALQAQDKGAAELVKSVSVEDTERNLSNGNF
jgi:hypothetical protein